MISKLIKFLAVIGIFGLFVWAIDGYLKLPTVHISHSAGKCIKVIDYQGVEILNGCQNMPAKYHKVIAK